MVEIINIIINLYWLAQDNGRLIISIATKAVISIAKSGERAPIHRRKIIEPIKFSGESKTTATTSFCSGRTRLNSKIEG